MRVCRQDDLVHRRLELCEGIANRRHRIALHDEAVRGDPLVTKERQGSVEPSPGGPPRGVLRVAGGAGGRAGRAPGGPGAARAGAARTPLSSLVLLPLLPPPPTASMSLRPVTVSF